MVKSFTVVGFTMVIFAILATLARLPVIALTAYAMVGDKKKAMEAGCDDYDAKPVDIERLLGKINAWLEK